MFKQYTLVLLSQRDYAQQAVIIWEVSRFGSGHVADNFLRHLKRGVDELKAYTGQGLGGIPALRLELFDLGPEMD